jgi:hypothetical protein
MIFLLEESRGSRRSPADHRSESRLSIPQRGALQRSSSLLPQPSSILKRTVEIVENYSVNGKCLLLRLSQLWGASHIALICLSRPSEKFRFGPSRSSSLHPQKAKGSNESG